jgi:glycogen synthase
MSTLDNCPVKTSLWGFLQTERVWLTQEQILQIVHQSYWKDMTTNSYNYARAHWLNEDEANRYAEILLTWFRNRTSEQKKLLHALEEKMRNFEKDTAEKLKQQIINNTL